MIRIVIIIDNKNLFTSGISQQTLFTYKTLINAGFKCTMCCVDPKYLFFGQDNGLCDIKVLTLTEGNLISVCNNTDLFLFLSSTLSENLCKIIKEQGVKIARNLCGNHFILDQENCVFDWHKEYSHLNNNYIDEYWLLPMYDFAKSYLEVITKKPVIIVPYVWDSTFVDKWMESNSDIRYKETDNKFILICEPNLSIHKTSLVPLCISEKANESIDRVICLCVKDVNKKGLYYTCKNFEIIKNNKVEFYGRMKLYEVLHSLKVKNKCPYIVSHQILNDLNFLQLELFYLGYPVIHNCDRLQNAGYYYKDHNVEKGCDMLKHSIDVHSIVYCNNYKLNCEKEIFKYSPANKKNINGYKNAVIELLTHNNLCKCKIPKILIQTCVKPQNKYVKKMIKKVFNGWDVKMFDDNKILDFFRNNQIAGFENIIERFNILKGAHKSDLFRYYFLYINGGCYLDDDAMLHTHIDNIIKDYDSVFIQSNFFKTFYHMFNGFICTYPKNPVILKALHHIYTTDYSTIKNYQSFCIQLYKIINSVSILNMKLYEETLKVSDNENKSTIYNECKFPILTHYFKDKIIPKNHIILNHSKIQLLGPFGTGTNLTSKILKNNLNFNLQIHPEGHTLIWKHSIDEKNIISTIEKNKDTIFIVMYKHVENWIKSMTKHHKYNIILGDTIDKECSFLGVKYDNLTDIYNRYYLMYMKMIKKYDNVIYLDYYSIIYEDECIPYINDKLKKFNIHIQNKNILDILSTPANKQAQEQKDNITDDIKLISKNVDKKIVKFYLQNCSPNTILQDIITFNIKDFKVSLYRNDCYITASFISGKYWEIDTLQNLKQYIDPTKNILEIGGHCGTSSLIYSKYLDEGSKIFVYEPQKNMYKLLKQNIQQNNLQKKIIPYNNCVFCEEIQLQMSNTDLDGNIGANIQDSYENKQPCNFGGTSLGKGGEKCQAIVLDNLDHKNIGFIHCDSQGSENYIFFGGKEFIKKHKPVIFYENNFKYPESKYLCENISKNYPQYETESKFNLEKYCVEELGYKKIISRFSGVDDLLVP